MCNADYTLEIRAIAYSNPSNRDYDGACCDPGFFSCNKCDVDFKFCVRAKGTSATSTSCWYSLKTSDDKSDSSGITFPSSGELYGGAGLTNPITFSRTGSWPVSSSYNNYITLSYMQPYSHCILPEHDYTAYIDLIPLRMQLECRITFAVMIKAHEPLVSYYSLLEGIIGISKHI